MFRDQRRASDKGGGVPDPPRKDSRDRPSSASGMPSILPPLARESSDASLPSIGLTGRSTPATPLERPKSGKSGVRNVVQDARALAQLADASVRPGSQHGDPQSDYLRGSASMSQLSVRRLSSSSMLDEGSPSMHSYNQRLPFPSPHGVSSYIADDFGRGTPGSVGVATTQRRSSRPGSGSMLAKTPHSVGGTSSSTTPTNLLSPYAVPLGAVPAFDPSGPPASRSGPPQRELPTPAVSGRGGAPASQSSSASSRRGSGSRERRSSVDNFPSDSETTGPPNSALPTLGDLGKPRRGSRQHGDATDSKLDSGRRESQSSSRRSSGADAAGFGSPVSGRPDGTPAKFKANKPGNILADGLSSDSPTRASGEESAKLASEDSSRSTGKVSSREKHHKSRDAPGSGSEQRRRSAQDSKLDEDEVFLAPPPIKARDPTAAVAPVEAPTATPVAVSAAPSPAPSTSTSAGPTPHTPIVSPPPMDRTGSGLNRIPKAQPSRATPGSVPAAVDVPVAVGGGAAGLRSLSTRRGMFMPTLSAVESHANPAAAKTSTLKPGTAQKAKRGPPTMLATVVDGDELADSDNDEAKDKLAASKAPGTEFDAVLEAARASVSDFEATPHSNAPAPAKPAQLRAYDSRQTTVSAISAQDLEAGFEFEDVSDDDYEDEDEDGVFEIDESDEDGYSVGNDEGFQDAEDHEPEREPMGPEEDPWESPHLGKPAAGGFGGGRPGRMALALSGFSSGSLDTTNSSSGHVALDGENPLQNSIQITPDFTLFFKNGPIVAPSGLIAPMEDIDEGDGTDLSLTQRKSRAESRKPRRLVRKPNNIKHELIVLKKLGHGASGTVNLALHVPSMQLVAVKYLRVFDPNARRSIVQELRTLYANMVPLLNSSGMNVNQAIGMSPGEAPPRPLIPHPAKQVMNDATMLLTQTLPPLETSPQPSPAEESSATHSDGSLVGPDHIVKFYDAYSTSELGSVGMVMEYMGGGSLQDIVDAGGIQDETELSIISEHILKGIAFLHTHRQLHRDIKPGNILMSNDGVVKLADFGIAKQLDNTASLALSFVGTQIYMSPERISGKGFGSQGYSWPSDIWAVGLSVLALAAGRFPFKFHENYFDMVHEVCSATEPPWQCLEGKGKFSPEFRDFITLTLKQDPTERPPALKLLEHPFIKRFAASGDVSGSARFKSSQHTRFASAWKNGGPDASNQSQQLDDIITATVGPHYELFQKYYHRDVRNKKRMKDSRSLDQSSMRVLLATMRYQEQREAAAALNATGPLSSSTIGPGGIAAVGTQRGGAGGDGRPKTSGGGRLPMGTVSAKLKDPGDSTSMPAGVSVLPSQQHPQQHTPVHPSSGRPDALVKLTRFQTATDFEGTPSSASSAEGLEDSFIALELNPLDVKILGQQLGLPPGMVCSKFNTALRRRLGLGATPVASGSDTPHSAASGSSPMSDASARLDALRSPAGRFGQAREDKLRKDKK